MRRPWSLILVFALLLAFPEHFEPSAIVETPASNRVFSTATERVYGVDISSEIFSKVSQDSYQAFVKKLTENGSRWISDPSTYSPANMHARNWLTSQLINLSEGRIEVETIGVYESVVGRLPGYLGAGPALMVGGHYDTVLGAPGANDDGSGVAAALELASVMSDYEWPLDVYFGFWNAEEIGLLGSREVARELQNRSVDILVCYNIDMLLRVGEGASPDEKVLMVYNYDIQGGYHVSNLWADIVKMMSKNLGNGIVKSVPYTLLPQWSLSDHASFLAEGYGSVLFAFENGFDNDTSYHQPSDAWDNSIYDYGVATETVASIGASMAHVISQAYGDRFHVEHSGTISSGSSAEFCFVLSIATDISVSAEWSEEASFSLYDPHGTLLGSYEDQGTSGSTLTIIEDSVTRFGLYRLTIQSTGTQGTTFTIQVEYDSDVDGNNVPDGEHLWLDLASFNPDTDGDALIDILEVVYGTDPSSPDSDGDLMTDGWEIIHGLDPLFDDSALDPDGGSLSNLEEFIAGTNPNSEDSDGDLLPDNWEIENDLDPLRNDASLDPDGDGETNLQEYQSGTNPNVYDVPLTIVVIGGVGAVVVVVTGGVFIKKRRGN
ncbi:MAG: M20/M25/M40 family metallo-hydrolase [Candidatus Thorarchaeota archaeon]